MKLFNKSDRIFAVARRRISPQETFEIDDKNGAKLLELYPTEIIQLEVKKVEKPVEKEVKRPVKKIEK